MRDRLLGRENKDIDIEVHGITSETLGSLLGTLGEVTAFGKSFGVFGLRHRGLDIAMPRSERAVGPGHQDFACRMDPSVYGGADQPPPKRENPPNNYARRDHLGARDQLPFRATATASERAQPSRS